MSFETIIVILQTLGPFTVLVTVYYLVTELKEQNRVARANARQNIADSHQLLTLKGMEDNLVKIKIKLKNNISLTEEEESIYVTHFTAILRARQSQHYQYSIGMLDQEEWEAMLASFRTLLRTKKNIEIWDWISPTFPKNFVDLVEEQRKII